MRQVLRTHALGRSRGMGWGGRWDGGSGWGTHVNPWLIHVNVWQNPLHYCKEISLKIIKINEKKEKKKKLLEQALGPLLQDCYSLTSGVWKPAGSELPTLCHCPRVPAYKRPTKHASSLFSLTQTNITIGACTCTSHHCFSHISAQPFTWKCPKWRPYPCCVSPGMPGLVNRVFTLARHFSHMVPLCATLGAGGCWLTGWC